MHQIKVILSVLWGAGSIALTLAEETMEISRNPLIPERVGLRGGFSMKSDTEQFHQLECVVGYDLPWHWKIGHTNSLLFKTGIEAAVGWLEDGSKDALLVSAGPEISIFFRDIPIALRIGSSPTYLSRHAFTHNDLGSEFQFTSYVGLAWQVTPHFQLSYRVQHMSNAGLASPNPGLNMHVCGFCWVF